MKCLLCCQAIADDVAVLTKECRHVFCLGCSQDKFDDQLVCPLCDTVLPKDGTLRINLKPDAADLMKVSEPSFGMQPKQLCAILQNSLEFWTQQQRNEGAMHVEALDKMKGDLQEEKSLNRKLTMNLEGERRKVKALLEEKSELIEQCEEWEKRYQKKSRDLRKLGESYKELRMVHKRLESDIRQTHLPSEMALDDSMHAPPNMIEDEEEEEDNSRRHEEHREGRPSKYEIEERELPGNSNSHSQYSRSVRNHQCDVGEATFDFKVRPKGEEKRRERRKESKTDRRGNRDGRKR